MSCNSPFVHIILAISFMSLVSKPEESSASLAFSALLYFFVCFFFEKIRERKEEKFNQIK